MTKTSESKRRSLIRMQERSGKAVCEFGESHSIAAMAVTFHRTGGRSSSHHLCSINPGSSPAIRSLRSR